MVRIGAGRVSEVGRPLGMGWLMHHFFVHKDHYILLSTFETSLLTIYFYQATNVIAMIKDNNLARILFLILS